MARNRLWRWLVGSLVGSVAVGGLALSLWLGHSVHGSDPVLAQSVDRLQQQRQQIQQQIKTNQQTLEQIQQQENTAKQNINSLQTNIKVTNTRIADNEFRLEQAQIALAKAQTELEALEAKLNRQRAGTAARLRYLQRQGAEHWWTLLLTSNDLNEFFDRRHQLQLLIEADRTLITELKVTADAVDQQRLALESQKNEIALILQELASQKNQLQQQVQQQQQLVERLGSQRNAYLAAQQRLAADSQKLAQTIQQLIAQRSQAGDPVQGTGRFGRPVGGPITSGFGWRVHPIYRSRRFHAGIDFGVSTGTPVRAADRGTVIYAGWYGGYGYTVIVNHGGGVTTLYAHNSRLLAGPGQAVQRGQTIAAAGSTGLSTGPHVHFEVRVNGQPVNPLRYL